MDSILITIEGSFDGTEDELNEYTAYLEKEVLSKERRFKDLFITYDVIDAEAYGMSVTRVNDEDNDNNDVKPEDDEDSIERRFGRESSVVAQEDSIWSNDEEIILEDDGEKRFFQKEE